MFLSASLFDVQCRHIVSAKKDFTPSPLSPHMRHLHIPNIKNQCSKHSSSVTILHSNSPKPRILIAGGGIGGLVFANAAKRRGFDVLVFEKDISAIRGEGQFRGPIQLQSSALAALEAIDMNMADQVMDAGCITGNRVNGIVDGLSGNWFVKFDTFTPAVERGLPVTRVISRLTLQEILVRALGDQDIILNNSNVVNFVDDGNKVTVSLENGEQFEGDLLVGADGIWSKVRKILFGPKDASYSGYTCYTGVTDFVVPDIDAVGYRVYLGHKQYFVSIDVGGGKMQWYAFHHEQAGGTDYQNGKKKRLLHIFRDWCFDVVDLIAATDEDSIIRRDIYDRPPSSTWGKGRVTLLGDSIHAIQPNMGQAGCMAIEDSYQLAFELHKSWLESIKAGTPMDIVAPLKRYERERWLRVAVIHGISRMAANMANMYRPYLGVGLGPLSFLTKFKIRQPGCNVGKFIINLAMPPLLCWVLNGNSSELQGRPLSCRLSDKASDKLQTWVDNADALEQYLDGEWYLSPVDCGSGNATKDIHLIKEENKLIYLGSLFQASTKLASITFKNNQFYLTDLRSKHGTWIINNEGKRHRLTPYFPVWIRRSNVIEFGSDKKAVYRVKVMKTEATTKIDGFHTPGVLLA